MRLLISTIGVFHQNFRNFLNKILRKRSWSIFLYPKVIYFIEKIKFEEAGTNTHLKLIGRKSDISSEQFQY